MQFALYVDNIVRRIDLQSEAYQQEEGIPQELFTVYKKQKAELLELAHKFGSVVSIDKLR